MKFIYESHSQNNSGTCEIFKRVKYSFYLEFLFFLSCVSKIFCFFFILKFRVIDTRGWPLSLFDFMQTATKNLISQKIEFCAKWTYEVVVQETHVKHS